jgi:glutamine phosphoribosylpyrophosphate amidotransferase
MCGVVGVSLRGVSESDFELVERVFHESMIRGKHATGVTWVQNDRLHTIKEPAPVDVYFKTNSMKRFYDEENDRLALIGHIRYSTSDLRHNQPFANDTMAISHNGVISQEPVESWPYKTETANDSELILRCFEQHHHPLVEFKHKSMAVCVLGNTGQLCAFRNHERPLWISELENGYIFTSTKDIALRSGLTNTRKCDKMYVYRVGAQGTLTVNDFFKDNSLEDLQPESNKVERWFNVR